MAFEILWVHNRNCCFTTEEVLHFPPLCDNGRVFGRLVILSSCGVYDLRRMVEFLKGWRSLGKRCGKLLDLINVNRPQLLNLFVINFLGFITWDSSPFEVCTPGLVFCMPYCFFHISH